MTPLQHLALVLVVVVGLSVPTCALCRVDPLVLARDRPAVLARASGIAPYAGALAAFYLFNRWSHAGGQGVSEAVGLHITGTLLAVEGDLVAHLQAAVPPGWIGYFSFVYLFGFSYLLVFPVLAYFVHPDGRHLKELFVAYAVNYGVGATCYVLFVAYGPRKALASVGAPMFERYPDVVALTAAVNSSANVFPSLHASFTATVALLAWRTRDRYPCWAWIASFVAANVFFATMYLGIHWLVDVIAGAGLAVVAVTVAARIVGDGGGPGGRTRPSDALDDARSPAD